MIKLLSFKFHFFLGFYFILNQYGEWIRPLQYRLHYSTVQCIVKLYHAFQNSSPS